jgi:hypothetical protein
MDLITRRNAAKKAGFHDNATEIDKLVHKSIRKDNQTYMKEGLRSHATQGLAESWPVLKRRRVGYKPRQTKLVQNEVTRPVQERANVLADHYANKQWASKPTPPLPQRPFIFEQQAPITTTDFTRLELDECIGDAKKGKASSPDEIPADLIALIDDSDRDDLLFTV